MNNKFLYVYKRVPSEEISSIYLGVMEDKDLTLIQVAESIRESCPLEGYEIISIIKVP